VRGVEWGKNAKKLASPAGNDESNGPMIFDPANQQSPDLVKPVRYGVVAVVPRDGRLLVIRRSATVLAPRAICFPGGGIEAGESEPQALVREIQEELNAEIAPLRRIWHNVTAWKISLSWWLASLAPDAELVPNPEEVEEIHWFTPEEIRAHPDLLQGNVSFLDALSTGQIDLK
jgi:8-oxo-dGTP diphosphatase